jgi:hypothetical protein
MPIGHQSPLFSQVWDISDEVTFCLNLEIVTHEVWVCFLSVGWLPFWGAFPPPVPTAMGSINLIHHRPIPSRFLFLSHYLGDAPYLRKLAEVYNTGSSVRLQCCTSHLHQLHQCIRVHAAFTCMSCVYSDAVSNKLEVL